MPDTLIQSIASYTMDCIVYRIGIGEVLAFHSAVFEKADVEKISLDAAAYRIAEDIRDYRQIGVLKQEHHKAIQQIWMLNTVVANKQQAIMTSNNGFVPIAEYRDNGRRDIEYGSTHEQWTTTYPIAASRAKG